MFNELLNQGFPFWGEMLIAAGLDLLIGDPIRLFHPVQLVGLWITKMERFLRSWIKKHPSKNEFAAERNAGRMLGIITVLLFGGLAWGIPWGLRHIPVSGAFVASLARIWLMSAAMAVHSLYQSGMRVYRLLKKHRLPDARQALSALVGRDTEQLSEQGVVRAACESLSENTNDGVIAPLFFMGVGGLFAFTPIGSLAHCFAWVYKSASTLDSMVGYRNKKYEHFGAFSARLDDVLALMPARISGFLIFLSAVVLRTDWAASLHLLITQHSNHPSPNSAWSESAAAGALGIRMGGGAYYGGVWKDSPVIGCDMVVPNPKHIQSMAHMMLAAALMALLLAAFLPLAMIVMALVLAIFGDWFDSSTPTPTMDERL